MSPEEIIQLTKKELDILYKIDNKHIIQLVDHFEDAEAVYLITEYLKGVRHRGCRTISTT